MPEEVFAEGLEPELDIPVLEIVPGDPLTTLTGMDPLTCILVEVPGDPGAEELEGPDDGGDPPLGLLT